MTYDDMVSKAIQRKLEGGSMNVADLHPKDLALVLQLIRYRYEFPGMYAVIEVQDEGLKALIEEGVANMEKAGINLPPIPKPDDNRYSKSYSKRS